MFWCTRSIVQNSTDSDGDTIIEYIFDCDISIECEAKIAANHKNY